MRNFLKIAEGIDVRVIHQQLVQNPELWNTNKFRTTFRNTPFADVDDIIIRYTAPDVLDPESERNAHNDHMRTVWYPAAEVLTSIKPIVLDLMRYVGGYELGRCLISRLRPGGRILRHNDNVGAYVQAEKIARYHVVIQGHPGSLYHCGDETVTMRCGEAWWFNALLDHAIENNSDDDRIHLVADFRVWG